MRTRPRIRVELQRLDKDSIYVYVPVATRKEARRKGKMVKLETAAPEEASIFPADFHGVVASGVASLFNKLKGVFAYGRTNAVSNKEASHL